MLDIGSLLYQLFGILIPLTIIILIVYFVRSTKKRNEHLRNIEKKLDDLQSKDK